MIVGSGTFQYDALETWERLPPGWTPYKDVPGCAVDSKSRVYVFARGEHPITVFNRDGDFIRSMGEGMFSQRAHGICIDGEDAIYCVDDGLHTVQKFSVDGKLLLTIGSSNKPTHKWQGQPFCYPTHVAVSPVTGDIFVTDGYGNSRVHKFSPDGRHLLSWGDPGSDPGQFLIPHNIAIDRNNVVYIADRENHRIQIFNADGKYLAMWNNIYRPSAICIYEQDCFCVAEYNGADGVGLFGLADCPGVGHRISILTPEGKLKARIGHPEEGDGPGQFVAPHSVATDALGDIYVGEVSYSNRGKHANPPKYFRCLRKLARRPGPCRV